MTKAEPALKAYTPSGKRLSGAVQAHLGKASRFADEKTRSWSLFFFFRIMTKAEMAANLKRIAEVLVATSPEKLVESAGALIEAVRNPAAVNAGVSEPASPGLEPTEDGPAREFLDWLKVVTTADAQPLGQSLREDMHTAGIPKDVLGDPRHDMDDPLDAILKAIDKDDMRRSVHRLKDMLREGDIKKIGAETVQTTVRTMLRAAAALMTDPEKFNDLLSWFGTTPAAAGHIAYSGGLPTVFLYELLRQLAPAQADHTGAVPATPLLRSEETQKYLADHGFLPRKWDPVPVNVAFTHSGLTALKLNPATLSSFPDEFKQGMAARAERLGDTGPSAPEHWEGVLGLDCVHGYFTGGYLAESAGLPLPEAWRQGLRDDIRAFNDRSAQNGWGPFLRAVLVAFTAPLGIEILQIELGEDPYDVKGGNAHRLAWRKEHFGFRDGISQPFIDMDLGDPPPGGGTPSRDRTWAPVAPGEIYLSERDEDGNKHALPANGLLRDGSTFVVFRKLEQDVAKFRTFLARQRPKDPDAQIKLASEFVGRWPNGTPLVLEPYAPLELGDDPEGLLNDFLYAADDPKGQSCPLSAHVRRTNPRDIGGTNDVRRHRILRRSIAYGGSLLPEKVPGDGKKRGLLFIAANSRIDLQFETIQADWINRGEILGQAGLNRCPLTGANLGGPSDAFLEAGAIAPVTGLPRFVITRGGDYFFAPGVKPMQAIANGELFAPQPGLPYAGHSMGDTKTPSLFTAERIRSYMPRLLAGSQPSVIRVEVPALGFVDTGAVPVAFVGQHQDVMEVLSMKVMPPGRRGKIVNSVAPYHETVQRLSRGYDMLVSAEIGNTATQKPRRRMMQILDAAWAALGKGVYARIDSLTKTNIEAALRRVGQRKRLDLVRDLAAVTTYDILDKLFGTPGPSYLTELAAALPFSHQHLTELQPDWLQAARLGQPDSPPLTTYQIWSILLFVDIVGNYDHQQELMALSMQAGSEFLNHLDGLISVARRRAQIQPVPAHTNLLAAFVSLEGRFCKQFKYGADAYYSDVRMLLLEMIGATLANIPATFGAVMGAIFKFNIPLTQLMPVLLGPPNFPPPATGAKPEDGVYRLIYETCRINGLVSVLMRTAMQDQVLPSGGKISKDDMGAGLGAGARGVPRVFPSPLSFSLKPFLPGKDRPIDKYLLFGATGGGRDCWGRDRLALLVVKECVKAAGRLQGLQKIAGVTGEARKFLPITIGLNAKFNSVLEDWP